MSSLICDYDPYTETELPPGALMICPKCGHWIYAGKPHRTDMKFPPPTIEAWFHDCG